MKQLVVVMGNFILAKFLSVTGRKLCLNYPFVRPFALCSVRQSSFFRFQSQFFAYPFTIATLAAKPFEFIFTAKAWSVSPNEVKV